MPVKQLNSIPKLVENVTVKFDMSDGMEIFIGDELAFSRRRNTWALGRGHYVSKAHVASEIFDFDDKPPVEQIELMESVIDLLADITDQYDDWKSEYLKQQWEKRRLQIPIPSKSYFDDQCETEDFSDSSFVYLMKHKNGYTKIGWSKNPQARERTLQAEDPMLEMLAYWKDERSAEKRLHDIFNSLRVRGEWFNLENHHIDWIIWILSKGKQTQ